LNIVLYSVLYIIYTILEIKDYNYYR